MKISKLKSFALLSLMLISIGLSSCTSPSGERAKMKRIENMKERWVTITCTSEVSVASQSYEARTSFYNYEQTKVIYSTRFANDMGSNVDDVDVTLLMRL